MRLIDADALIDNIPQADLNNGKKISKCGAIADMVLLVCDAPTISAAPVVRGEWVAEQKNAEYCEFRCSACDHSVGHTDQFDETEVEAFSEWYRYCPNCGAKMESEGST